MLYEKTLNDFKESDLQLSAGIEFLIQRIAQDITENTEAVLPSQKGGYVTGFRIQQKNIDINSVLLDIQAKDIAATLNNSFGIEFNKRILKTPRCPNIPDGSLSFGFSLPENTTYNKLLKNACGLIPHEIENLLQKTASEYFNLAKGAYGYLQENSGNKDFDPRRAKEYIDMYLQGTGYSLDDLDENKSGDEVLDRLVELKTNYIFKGHKLN